MKKRSDSQKKRRGFSLLVPIILIFSVFGTIVVTCPAKREKTLKYALQTVKNRPSGLLFSQNTLNLSKNKSKVFNAS